VTPSEDRVPGVDGPPKAQRPALTLIGGDGNAFNILGKALRALRHRRQLWLRKRASGRPGELFGSLVAATSRRVSSQASRLGQKSTSSSRH
jgi:hypothetical protein